MVGIKTNNCGFCGNKIVKDYKVYRLYGDGSYHNVHKKCYNMLMKIAKVLDINREKYFNEMDSKGWDKRWQWVG